MVKVSSREPFVSNTEGAGDFQSELVLDLDQLHHPPVFVVEDMTMEDELSRESLVASPHPHS